MFLSRKKYSRTGEPSEMIILLSKRSSIVSKVTVKAKPSEIKRMLPLCALTSVQCPLKHVKAVEASTDLLLRLRTL